MECRLDAAVLLNNSHTTQPHSSLLPQSSFFSHTSIHVHNHLKRPHCKFQPLAFPHHCPSAPPVQPYSSTSTSQLSTFVDLAHTLHRLPLSPLPLPSETALAPTIQHRQLLASQSLTQWAFQSPQTLHATCLPQCQTAPPPRSDCPMEHRVTTRPTLQTTTFDDSRLPRED